MRKFRNGWAALLLMAASGAPAWGETLIITGDVWCPINCAAKASKPGIFVELAQQIFGEEGIRVEYQTVNWARAILDVRQGRANALIGAGRDDAPDFLFSATAPAISRMCFYTQPGTDWRYDGLASLATISLAVINGYSYGEELNGYIHAYEHDNTRVQTAAGDQALGINVEKVLRGRANATLENTWVMARYLSRRAPPAVLRRAGCRTPDVPIYLAFAPKLASSQRYMALFEAGVQRYRENGRLRVLLASYGLRDGEL
ncbi:transporter substrate-binding domain-containing protein [Pseudomonas sp. UL073]|uniref:Transporter substrate-binding domain-containing protein n=1 Tax=Zestomonas insulae TaxID=2809017 RepID=A0ABS2IBG6_9GAMM|nr:transporter substrate-binding domain-containing protein [Pseudomonas insulae]MBM7060466.1 transporter substrate-binding domain-containing protein [Pseudomonas insulae]